MKKTILILWVLVAACAKDSENYLLKPVAFQEKLTSTPGAVILDVRTPDEVRKEYIKGAINFDFNTAEFNILIAGMDKKKPYFVYCASGVRSGKAADRMRSMDFEKVYLLDGGIKAWKAEGLPTKTPAPAASPRP
jgi:rhodanese-related sulfurtransferase